MIDKQAIEACEETCIGTEINLQELKAQMIDGESVIKLSELFKALGDPTRVRLIYAMSQSELCVHDLSVLLDMGQSAVSHQLKYLWNLRIVKRRKSGKTVYYSLDDTHIEEIFLQTLQHIKHD